jgi:hypothetical protein
LADTGKSLQWTVRFNATGIRFANSSHRKAPLPLVRIPRQNWKASRPVLTSCSFTNSRRHAPHNGEGYGRPMAIWLLKLEPQRPTENQHLPESEHTALCGSYNPLYGLEQCRKRARPRDINFVRQNLYFWRQTILQSTVVIASYSL